MNKKSIVILFFFICLTAVARTTYIPSYYSQITIEDSADVVVKQSVIQDLVISPKDERYTIVVMHDTITKERIRNIKRMNAARNLSILSAVTGVASSFISATLTPITFADAIWQEAAAANGLKVAASSAYLAYASNQVTKGLEKLPITIVIENNTEKDLYVNDLARGLTWYIRGWGVLSLSVSNPEINNFRISNTDPWNMQASYVNIEACNILMRINVAYEDDECWGYAVEEEIKGQWVVKSYILKSKSTLEEKELTKEEFRRFKIAHSPEQYYPTW